MGMALPALAGELLPEKTAGQAARLLSFRHAGITIALLILAPIAAGQLDSTVSDVRENGAALVLDARLPPLDKVEMAGPLVADLDPTDARDGLERALDGQAHRFADDPEDKAEYAKLTQRADDVLVGRDRRRVLDRVPDHRARWPCSAPSRCCRAPARAGRHRRGRGRRARAAGLPRASCSRRSSRSRW